MCHGDPGSDESFQISELESHSRGADICGDSTLRQVHNSAI